MRPPGRISDGHEVERAMPRILQSIGIQGSQWKRRRSSRAEDSQNAELSSSCQRFHCGSLAARCIIGKSKPVQLPNELAHVIIVAKAAERNTCCEPVSTIIC